MTASASLSLIHTFATVYFCCRRVRAAVADAALPSAKRPGRCVRFFGRWWRSKQTAANHNWGIVALLARIRVL